MMALFTVSGRFTTNDEKPFSLRTLDALLCVDCQVPGRSSGSKLGLTKLADLLIRSFVNGTAGLVN